MHTYKVCPIDIRGSPTTKTVLCDGGALRGPELTLIEYKPWCELHQITFAYPNAEQEVLKNADMVIPFGRSVGVIGTSGAGKTTAVDIMLGLLHQAEGDVLVDAALA